MNTPAVGLTRRSGSAIAARRPESPGAARVRRTVATLFLLYGVTLIVTTVLRGNWPYFGHFVILMAAAALYANRGGRFARDWLPVFLGLYGYALAAGFASKLNFPIHYLPQIDADKLLGFGTLPTVWLQQHLYGGTTGPLEVFTVVMYLSHFIAPVLLAFYIWWTGRRDAFYSLVFGILAVSVLAEITFILAPTAPPWMAAQHGFLPPVHHILKQALYDIHLSKAAMQLGNPNAYNVVAAVPSLHAAWPLIGLLVIRRFRLPRWLFFVQLGQFLGVLFAIVYAGEHYVFDAIAGAAYAVVASLVVAKAMSENRAAGTRIRVKDRVRAWQREPVMAALADDEGQVLLEYALILFFVSISAVTLLGVLGSEITSALAGIVSGL